MIRPALLCFLTLTLQMTTSHAVPPGTGTALDDWTPAAPTAAVKQATAQAKAQTERERLAREAREAENRVLKRQLADEQARRKAAEASSEDNRRKADAAAKKLTPGQVIQDCPDCPKMVVIPAGNFIMGSDKGEADESPVHSVRVAQAFAMGETELSFAQWDACVNDIGSALRCKRKPDDGWGRGDHPVINVSYDDIVSQYLPWLNDKTKANPPYRIPTEAEWEFAARAGGKGEYSLGPANSDKLDSNKANYDANYSYAGSPIGQFREKTVPVNSFEPNAFGIYNMHGNVWEWTADCYNSEEYKRRKTSSEWLAHKTSDDTAGCTRVLRGGSWIGNPVILRSANRNNDVPFASNYFRGVRLARTLLP